MHSHESLEHGGVQALPSPSFKTHQVPKPVRAERRAGHRHSVLGVAVLGLVAQGGHRKPQHSSEPLLLSPYCAQHCAAGGRGGWRLMPNLCPSCSSTPELLLGLRPDRLPGYSPPAQQPHGHSADSGKKLKMKAGVIEVNWGSKTGRSIVPISLQAAVRACGESRDSGSRSSTHS